MGLFRPYERKADTDQPKTEQRSRIKPRTSPKAAKPAATATATKKPAASGKTQVSRSHTRKQGATKSRKQAEAERMERLHPSLTPRQQRKADRQAAAEARADAWDKLERSKERVLLRNYLDSQWTLTEFLIPAMLLVMVAVMATSAFAQTSAYIALGLWVLLLASFIEIYFKWRGYKKVLAHRYPGTSPKGLVLYMYNRAMMIRRFRRPAPAVERGGEF
ncbi:MAG: hypothetical protein CSA64_04185 [Arachnia propionica]|nr:MAG: hypothetical protein CSA64_04185 [Arachnia propionica]